MIGQVEIGFVERQRLNQVGEPMQDAADCGRFPPINVESGRHDDQLRASLQGHESRHRGSNPELARLIIAGC